MLIFFLNVSLFFHKIYMFWEISLLDWFYLAYWKSEQSYFQVVVVKFQSFLAGFSYVFYLKQLTFCSSANNILILMVNSLERWRVHISTDFFQILKASWHWLRVKTNNFTTRNSIGSGMQATWGGYKKTNTFLFLNHATASINITFFAIVADK